MGALADTMGITLGSSVLFCMAQVPAFLAIISIYPMVEADVFSTKIKTILDPATNLTAVDLVDPIETHYLHSINISAAFLLTSGLVAAVGIMTYQIKVQGISNTGIDEEEYVSENVDVVTHPTVTLWNNSFVVLVVWSHIVIIAIVCSPCSMHLLFMTALFIYTAFKGLLCPRHGRSTFQSAHTGSLMGIAIYIIGMSYVATNVAIDSHMRKAQTIAAFVLCDLFTLIIGHAWDQNPTFGTISNCRLLYLCFVTIVNMVLYISWHSAFKIHFLHAPAVNTFA